MPRLPHSSPFDQTGSHAYLHRFDGTSFGPCVTVPIHGQ